MAQQQQNIDIVAPGFMGLNLEMSPVGLGLEWAARAENAIIDPEGRIGSRKGIQMQTTNGAAELGGEPIVALREFTSSTGSVTQYSAGNLKLFYGINTITPMDYPDSYTVTGNNWQIVPFKGYCYFLQAGHEPLMTVASVDPTVLELAPTDLIPNSLPWGQPNCGTAGEGHMWLGGFDADKSIAVWSAQITDGAWASGEEWNGGDSGYKDLSEDWPTGFDEITGMKVHNNYLYIFGKRSILIYSGAHDPTHALTLVDTVSGIGCVARDSITTLGKDIYFLDANGIRSMGRTIQEVSAPIGDVSANVHKRIMEVIREQSVSDLDTVRAEYSPEEFLYLITFPASELVIAFDTRGPTETGGSRTTTWPVTVYAIERSITQETYMGSIDGISEYQNSIDTDANMSVTAIKFVYQTHPQSFDNPVTQKFPKQVDVAYRGGSGQDLVLSWGYDFREPIITNSLTASFPTVSTSEYGIAEYGIAEYTDFNAFIDETHYNIWGSGKNIAYRFTMDVDKTDFAIQMLNMQTLSGRIL